MVSGPRSVPFRPSSVELPPPSVRPTFRFSLPLSPLQVMSEHHLLSTPASSSSAPHQRAAEQVMNQMYNDMQQMHSQIQSLQAQLAQQQQQPPTSSAPSSAPSLLTSSIRLPTLPQFKGTLGRELDDWRVQVQLQFDAKQIPDGPTRVANAAACFSGIAAQWWDRLPSPEKQAIMQGGWSDLIDRLRQRFCPVQASMMARQQLDRHRQRTGQSVNAYANSFQSVLTAIEDMSTADQIHLFVKGLNSNIAAKVIEKRPADLGAAIEAAVIAEATLQYGRSLSSSSGYLFQQRHSSAANSSSSSSVPMDINHIHAEQGFDIQEQNELLQDARPEETVLAAMMSTLKAMDARINAITQNNSGNRQRTDGNKPRGEPVNGLPFGEIERRRREGLCFKCGAKGHMKLQCTQKKPNFQ